MAEHERDLIEMVSSLEETDRLSERKARLFLVAVCRRISDLLPDRRSRHAVDVAERFADGLASRQELEAAHAAAHAGRMEYIAWTPVEEAAEAAEDAASPTAAAALFDVALNARQARATANGEDWNAELWYGEEVAQADLLRCVFGNPFRSPPPLDPAWLSWNNGTIRRLAEVVYEVRSFQRLPVLADALEEAGCTDEEVLSHLRGPGPHARGCFAVDAVLGRA